MKSEFDLIQILVNNAGGGFWSEFLDVNAKGDWSVAVLSKDGTPVSVVKIEVADKEADALGAELRTIVDESRPTDALFRTNHASNYVPIAGRLPRDREALIATIDAALRGDVPMRSEAMRAL